MQTKRAAAFRKVLLGKLPPTHPLVREAKENAGRSATGATSNPDSLAAVSTTASVTTTTTITAVTASISAISTVAASVPTLSAITTALATFAALGHFGARFAAALLLFATASVRAAATHFLVAFRHRCATREFDAAFLIDAEAFHPDLIAEFDDVFGLLDAEVGEFADMDEAVLAGQELDERAKVFDGNNFAAINLADFGFGGHADDCIAGDLHAFFRDGEDVHCAIVLDIDLAAGFFDEFLDVLAAGADERADLLGVDLDGLDARRVLAQFLARSTQGLGHFGQNVHASDARFLDGISH